MTAPSRKPGRIRLFAAAVFLLLIAVGIYLQSRPERAPDRPPSAGKVTTQNELPSTNTSAPLDRAALLDAVADASDAYARGEGLSERSTPAVGQAFKLRLPFGCYGPTSAEADLREGWTYDAETSVLRLAITPHVWTDARWLKAIIGTADIEAAEGFWLQRPWQRDDSCPAYRSPFDTAALTQAPRQTVALVELFSTGSSRVHRRDGRPYEATGRVPVEQASGLKGFQLVLEGRLGALSGNRPVGCWSEDYELPPICAVAIEVDKVSLINPVTEDTYGAWQR